MKKTLSVATFLFLLAMGKGLSAESLYHCADYKPADGKISLTELLRVVQLYNGGSYHCDNTAEDGYAPGDGDKTCNAHNSDYDPHDWKLGLGELLRMVQFYNSDGYHEDSEAEDGFAAGMSVSEEPSHSDCMSCHTVCVPNRHHTFCAAGGPWNKAESECLTCHRSVHN